MITSTLLLGALSVLPGDDKTVLPPVYALRVGRAETIAKGTVEHAVVLVENGKITVVGEDLPIERGIPIFDHPDWVVMPGLVSCRSRAGLGGRGGNAANPEVKASAELYPGEPSYTALLEAGVTTVGLVPAGEGIPGQAVGVRTQGSTAADLILKDPAYLYMQVRADTKSKKMILDGFAGADEHAEKVKKAKEKWEKEQEKSKKAKPKEEEKKGEEKKGEEKAGEQKQEEKKEEKKEDEKKDEGKDKKEGPVFTPPEPDPKVKPFIELREGKLSALFDISKAGEYLHMLDVLGEEKIAYSVVCALRDDIDLYEISEKLGKTGGRIVLTPEITLQPFTRRDRNLPAEMSAAGAKVALLPRSDSPTSYATWLPDVGNLVRFGLDRAVALRALTLEPAEVLGVADRLGTLEAGKDANLILLDGDPFEPRTRIRMVILEGKNAYEYEAPTTGGDDEQ